jgi:hypothetical protein
MGHSPAAMTARYTGKIPIEQLGVVTRSDLRQLGKVIESFHLEDERA